MITVDKNTLANTLKNLYSVIPQNSSLQVLKNFVLEFNNETLTISTCNLEIFAQSSIPATSDSDKDEGWKGLFISKEFFELIKDIPYNTKLFLKQSKTILNIKTEKNFKAKIYFSDTRDYPDFPEIDLSNEFIIENKLLFTLLDKTSFCADINEARKEFQSINLTINSDNTIDAKATDGHKLSIIKMKSTFEYGMEKDFLLHKSHCPFIMQNLNKDQNSALYFGEKYMLIKGIDSDIYVKIFYDVYPDIQKVIPKTHKGILIVNKKDVLDSLKMLSALANKKTKLIL